MGRERVGQSEYAPVAYALIGAVLIAVIAAGYLLRDNLTGSPAELRSGDCFNVPDLESFGSVSHIPCGEPHTAEAFLIGRLEGSNDRYPEDADFVAWREQACDPLTVATYTGERADAVGIAVGLLYPTPESWKAGGRLMVCYLRPVDDTPTTGSLRATPVPSD